MAHLIVAIKPTGRRSKLLLIELDDGQTVLLSSKSVAEAGLESGGEIEVATLREVVDREQGPKALDLSLRNLTQRPRSEAEIRRKLSQRRFSETVVDSTVTRLSEKGLLDDRRFAEQWVESRLRLRPRGRRVLRQELLGKGVAADLVDEVLSQDLAEANNALAIAEKAMRSMRSLDSRAVKRRLEAMLVRRGYNYEVVNSAIRQIMPDEPDTDDKPSAC